MTGKYPIRLGKASILERIFTCLMCVQSVSNVYIFISESNIRSCEASRVVTNCVSENNTKFRIIKIDSSLIVGYILA